LASICNFMRTNFLLLHGYGGKSTAHWQSHLAKFLYNEDQNFKYPDFPDSDFPDLDKWMHSLDKVFEHFNPASLVVAGHSLGCALWLHYAKKRPDIKPKKAYLVSPPINSCGIPEIAGFFPLPDLDLSGQDYLIIGSDNDNFIPQKDFEALGEKYKIPLKILRGAGHINAPVHGHWEWMQTEFMSFLE
jgi:uncharacterized protein